jgi:cell division septation protein DedD
MMNTIAAGKRALPVCLLLLLAVGCSREQQDWRSAESTDTIEAYTQFIQRHPESELTTEARTRVEQLEEEHDWAHAGSADTAEAYQRFLVQHPIGRWAQEARIRIDNFSLGAKRERSSGNESRAAGMRSQSKGAGSTQRDADAWASGADSHPASALSADRASGDQASPPVAGNRAGTVPLPSVVPASAELGADAGPQRSAVPASLATGAGSFGVQLGAFSSESAADNRWRALSDRFGAEMQGLSERVVAADISTAGGRGG